MTRLGFGALGTRRVLGALVVCSIYAGAACGGSSEVEIPPDDADAAGSDAQSDGSSTDGAALDATDSGGQHDAATEDGATQDGATEDASDAGADATTDAPSDANDASMDVVTDVAADVVSDVAKDVVNDVANDVTTDASQDAAPDVVTDAGPDVIVIDAGTDSGTDASVCPEPALTGTDRHVYVDKSVLVSGNGSLACPFKTILEATAATTTPPVGSALTIHVKGTGGTIYDEASPVFITERTTLTSAYPPAAADPTLVTVRAQGNCAVATKCVIDVTGGKLEGLTITDPAGAANVNGIRAVSNPTIVNTTVQNTSASGILVELGGAEIGPGVYANGNATDGVRAVMPATVPAPSLVIVGGGRGNRFNNNGASGIRALDGVGTRAREASLPHAPFVATTSTSPLLTRAPHRRRRAAVADFRSGRPALRELDSWRHVPGADLCPGRFALFELHLLERHVRGGQGRWLLDRLRVVVHSGFLLGQVWAHACGMHGVSTAAAQTSSGHPSVDLWHDWANKTLPSCRPSCGRVHSALDSQRRARLFGGDRDRAVTSRRLNQQPTVIHVRC